MAMEINRIKDFLILHYNATERTDTEFWKYCHDMHIPEDLGWRMELFKNNSHVSGYEEGFFSSRVGLPYISASEYYRPATTRGLMI